MSAAAPRPEPRPAARATLAPVHYVPSGTAPACLPHDPPNASRHRKSTAVPAGVTCWHCRKAEAWQEADLFGSLEAYVTGGAL